MTSYLLVAHQTAQRREFVKAAQDLAATNELAEFTLLVPATPIGNLLVSEEGETLRWLDLPRGRLPVGCTYYVGVRFNNYVELVRQCVEGGPSVQ